MRTAVSSSMLTKNLSPALYQNTIFAVVETLVLLWSETIVLDEAFFVMRRLIAEPF